MKTYFPPEFFAGNRKNLRKLFAGKAPIVITANALLQRNSDIAFPFRQDSNFWYLTGIDEPELILVMDKDKEYLIVPDRTDVRNVFDGRIDKDRLIKRSGIAEILEAKVGWKRLRSRLSRAKHAATLSAPAVYVDTYEFYTNPARASLTKKLKENSPGLELLDLKRHFIKMRMIKQLPELEAIKGSVELTAEALKQLKTILPKLRSEYEAEAFLTNFYRSKAARHGYTPMVAGGANACVLHYDTNNDKFKDNDLLLVDTGAELEFYSADITRTFSLGKPSKRQQAVYKAVEETLEFALSNLRPGISVKENERLVEQFIGEKIRELGLIKVIDRDSVRKYFPHATSHFLGLDLHDAADYETSLCPGMVLTVEPGIYIPEEGIGVRIEEDVLVTKTGAEILSSSLPTGLS